MEDVAGKTFRMHSNENALIRITDISEDERDVLVVIYVVSIADNTPHAVVCRQSRLCNAVDKPLRAQAVRNELCDSDERELVLLSEFLELRSFRSRAVII